MICSEMLDAADILAHAPEGVAPSGDAASARASEHGSDPLLERQLQLLGRLAEAGLEVAIACEREAKAVEPGSGSDLNALARAYARAARAVRLTVMLQSRLIKARQEAGAAVEAASRAAAEEASQALRNRENDAKARVSRIVRRVIEAEHDDEDRIERLDGEAMDRLDDEDVYGAVLTRPMSEMVADICRDLGLNPDWAKLAEECWALEEIGGGEVGEPLEAFRARPPPRAAVSSVAANDLAAMRTPAEGGPGGIAAELPLGPEAGSLPP